MQQFVYSQAYSCSDELAEAGRKLFAGPCEFIKGVVSISNLPIADRPEVCFAGRSNVGKSSLINALTGRRSLSRTSNTPGRTQEINFFALGNSHYLVDLPGYGFAASPPQVVKRWQQLVRKYLIGRSNLRRAFVLIDSRHGIKAIDREIFSLLDAAAVSFQVILTKIDKVKESAIGELLYEVHGKLSTHPAAFPKVVVTSSAKNVGIVDLRSIIAEFEETSVG
ncbi:MAG: ribosome biogenesis GTP-binding protein YihA/YsxC [Aestuariivita sp.]|nr:ribosome biogenesis GTP-binding protein YihA/YsxC [Aestuariivita sp.]MCY4201296.1 ribosome biogenesis GTP-binding protein YihA/YsxC [Aestuariivita sp.]MCY4289483.1 ribosome biogenesis GTP-binding protein YihA/YsxC [Aestuariivita sp.]MCY4347312.1 ribosome biogenesis GTP-binding protein YihA/YsxC [Aestuariivita sp.]